MGRPEELTVVLDNPESVQLCDTVRRPRVERRRLRLRSLDDFAVKFRSRGLRQPTSQDTVMTLAKKERTG